MRALFSPALMAAAAFVAVSMLSPAPAQAERHALTIGESTSSVTGQTQKTLTINGQMPGPTLRLKEGEMAEISVTNTLSEDTSIHWHGLILPYQQDGVPGFSFQGIKPGETVTYRFPVVQSGTYWYHSHSGLQEQAGVLAPIVIEPKDPDPIAADRDVVVMLSDFHRDDPNQVLANLKKNSGYYTSGNRRTLGTLMDDAQRDSLGAALQDRLDWGAMRMAPTDLSDIAGYTFLVNGQAPANPWRTLFKPGEKLRLRFINGAAMTYFDVRIPGLKLTVVAADGNLVKPVTVDEFRISVGETYDVVVEPTEDKPYTIFAEPLDRSGYARATLTPRDGEDGPIPDRRKPGLLTMTDMGAGMDHSAHSTPAPSSGQESKEASAVDHSTMDHSAMGHGSTDHSTMDHSAMGHGSTDHSAMDHTAMDHTAMGHGSTDHSTMDHSAMGHGSTDHNAQTSSPLPTATVSADVPASSGLVPTAADGGRMLRYADLLPLNPHEQTAPTRSMTVRLGGNMERYFWTMDGEKFSSADPYRMTLGERVRVTLVNETMMNHPIHLHGMWFQVVRSDGQAGPLKHVLNVPPGQSVTLDLLADAVGQWPFHCHFMYHMATGMMRRVIVDPPADSGAAPTPPPAAPTEHQHQHSGASHG